MKVELTEKNFCKIMDTLEDYYRRLNDLGLIIGEISTENPLYDIFDCTINFLGELFYGNNYEKLLYDDISYYVYDLDFGVRWKPSTITDKEGNDIPLRNACDLYHLLCLDSEEK